MLLQEPSRMSFSTIWFPSKKVFKIEKWAQRGARSCGEGKNVTMHEEGFSERQISDKLKF